MSEAALSRRAVLVGLGSLVLSLALPTRRAAANLPGGRTFDYRVDISMLFDLVRYSVAGTMVEEVDADGGRYRVLITGSGTGVSTRIEARGLIDNGRYRPLELKSAHSFVGRPSSLSIIYDYARGLVEYHAVGHTLLRGRRRQVDDIVVLVPGQPVDDAVSAGLNFAAGRLEQDPDGAYRMAVLRRTRPRSEGPDDVTPGAYRVEVVPVRFQVDPDVATGKLNARLDMSGWSSWARADQPARLVFTPERRLESFETRLIWGSAVRMRFS
jgi:hypothetical protein